MTITERAVVVVVGRSAAVRVAAAGAPSGAHRTPGRRRARVRPERAARGRGIPPRPLSQPPHGPESGDDQGDVQAHRL